MNFWMNKSQNGCFAAKQKSKNRKPIFNDSNTTKPIEPML